MKITIDKYKQIDELLKTPFKSYKNVADIVGLSINGLLKAKKKLEDAGKKYPTRRITKEELMRI